MEFLQQLQAWHWLTLGLILLGAEALGAGGFVLGAAIAALVQAAVMALIPGLSWQVHLTVFAFNSVMFSVLYWKVFRNYNEKSDHPQINDRAAQLIGKKITLQQDLPSGQGKLQLGDTFWKVESESALKTGELIEVVRAEKMTLIVKPVNP